VPNEINPKKYSIPLTEGPNRAAARSYLRGVGFSKEDLHKPIIGVANTWTEIGPCNFHLRDVAAAVKQGIRDAGGTPMEFNTVTISDGITMGTEGMKASLVSREVIADSIELMARGHMFDGVIAMSGFYDLGPDYLHGYGDDNAYFNNPASYLPSLEGPSLHLLQTSSQIQILTGQGDYEAPHASRQLADLLSHKGIPHSLEMWGHDVSHDWPWWRKMLPYAVDKMGW